MLPGPPLASYSWPRYPIQTHSKFWRRRSTLSISLFNALNVIWQGISRPPCIKSAEWSLWPATWHINDLFLLKNDLQEADIRRGTWPTFSLLSGKTMATQYGSWILTVQSELTSFVYWSGNLIHKCLQQTLPSQPSKSSPVSTVLLNVCSQLCTHVYSIINNQLINMVNW